MGLSEDVSRIAALAASHADAGQQVSAVLATESAAGKRVYLAAFDDGAGNHEWLALAEDGGPVTNRARVREAASIAALVEVAEEAGERASEEPRLASLAYLDSLGGDSSLAGALPAIDELTRDIEAHYKLELT